MSLEINDLLIKLETNMLSLKNINNFSKHVCYNKCTKMSETNKTILEKKSNNDIYKIKYKDTLFWCFYILKYGISKYEIDVENRNFTIEKEEKYKYISLLRNNKELLKSYKIKPLNEVENELANKEYISIKTFIALCIVENINIFLIDNRKYIEIILDSTKPINIIHKESNNNIYYIEMKDNIQIKLEYYKNNYLQLNNYDYKLKALSSYKLDELIDMCKRLNINLDLDKKLNKKDIYELLTIKIR
jgi:hypothetical protein